MDKRSHHRRALLAALPLAAALAFGSLPVQAGGSYGAIALSPSTGGHGYAFGLADRGQAENAAIGECAKYSGAGDCISVISVEKGCAALAAGADSWGSAAAKDLASARAAAVRNCQSAGSGRNCKVVRWLCR